MKQKIVQKNMIVIIFSLFIVLFVDSAFGQEVNDRNELLVKTAEPFSKGEYEKAIRIFDEILKNNPNDIEIIQLKGLALSNLRLEATLAMQPQQNLSPRDPSNLNKLSMIEFYKALEINPNSVLALNGIATGFGNFGEYSEAERYFKKSLAIEPNNDVIQNYLVSIQNIKKKYALDSFEDPTKKPVFLKQLEEKTIPSWIKNNAGWWSAGEISDDDFISGIEYLIKNRIISITSENSKENLLDTIPSWIKNNAGWWSAGEISDDDFLSGITYLVKNNIIMVDSQIDSEETQNMLDRKAWNFELYLRTIQQDIKNKNRYVENLNPSEYVIIKYWKDYNKWNLEQFLNRPSIFPDRSVFVKSDGNYIIEYKVHINEQPPGLPLDHVSTLEDSFRFWEEQEYDTTDGKKASIVFKVVSERTDANVWVTWVVRSLGEGVLGHANLGKGVVEVAIGNYSCDGTFQLFDTDTVQAIMTHELGHSLGFGHSDDPDKIMYPTISHTSYSYCLLN